MPEARGADVGACVVSVWWWAVVVYAVFMLVFVLWAWWEIRNAPTREDW